MPKKEKSLGLNAGLNGLKAILSVIFPLITYPYALRVLQVDNIGKVRFAASVVSYFTLLSALGIVAYATREGAIIRDDRKKLEDFSRQMFTINAFSVIASYILLALITIAVPKFHSYTMLIAVQSLTIFGNFIGITWLYSIVEDYAYITIRSLVIHIVALILLFAFVHDESDYVFYAATTVIANTGANIFNLIHSRKYIRIGFTRHVELKRHLRPLMIIFASNVTSTIYVNSDMTILGFLASDYYVGLYTAAVNVYTVLKLCITAVIQVSLPRLSNYLANGLEDRFHASAMYIYRMFMVLLMPVVTGVFVTSDAIIRLVGGESYAAAGTAMRILSLSLFFSMLATYYTNAVLLPMKKERTVLTATAVSAAVNIILNMFLLRTFKQNGAAFTTLLAEILMFAVQYKDVRGTFKVTAGKRFFPTLIGGCAGILAASAVCDLMIRGIFINLAVKIVCAAMVYAAVLVGGKNEAAMELLGKIKRK